MKKHGSPTRRGYDRRPIGIFDSGVGGLTVVREVRKLLPHEDIVYFGDTARVPYGTKSKETVTKFSVENVEFLMRHNVKLVIVACNTASSLSLGFLTRCFKVPIMGVIEPGARFAARSTRTGHVGVVGTNATVRSGAYEKALRKTRRDVRVFSASCPLFVPLVEEGWLDNAVARSVVRTYLGGFQQRRIDTLVLGCTHYPLLKKAIGACVGRSVALIDSAEAVAREARDLLARTGLMNGSSRRGRERYFVSDEPSRFVKLAERFLSRRISCVKRVS